MDAKSLPEKTQAANQDVESVATDSRNKIADSKIVQSNSTEWSSDPKKGANANVKNANWPKQLVKIVKKVLKILIVIAALSALIAIPIAVRSCRLSEEQVKNGNRANDLAENAEHRQLANYFDVEAKLITDRSGAKVKVSAKNASQSPAKQVSIKVDDYWEPFPPLPKDSGPGFATKMGVDDGQRVDVVPGSEIYLVHNVDASRIGRLRNHHLTLHISVELSWANADGDRELRSYYFVQGGTHETNAEVMSADK
jgi:hypothetical protein